MLTRAMWVLFAVNITACSSGPEMVAPSQAILIPDDSVARPGTPIGAGFQVERGSVLLGASLPQTRVENGAQTGIGFVARIAVTDEPYRTFRRYVDRAVDLGFALKASPPGYCEVVRPEKRPIQYVTCSTYSLSKDPLDGRPGDCRCEPHMFISLSYGKSFRGTPLSYITLGYSPAHNPERFVQEPGAPPGPLGRVPTIRVRSGQRGPGIGGLIGRLCGYELHVTAGSRVIAMYSEHSAVLEVTGEPRQVLSRYATQIERVGPLEHVALPEGELWAHEGDGYHLKMFRTAGRTWLDASLYEASAC